MRFGLALPHYDFSLPGGERISFDGMARFARMAERLEFDSAWVSDHFFLSLARYGGPRDLQGSLEAMTTLAGLAATTEHLRLGALVLAAPFRHPAVLAKAATAVDLFSGGRLDLGIGAGWYEEEFRGFGYGFGTAGERFAVLDETLEVLGQLLPGGPATFAGRHFQLHEAFNHPSPAQTPRPPPHGVPAVGMNTVWRWAPEAYGKRVRRAREACDEEGRDPRSLRLSLGMYTVVGEDNEDLVTRFRTLQSWMPGGALDRETLESFMSDTLTGTPDQVLERVARFAELGVEEVIVAPAPIPFALPDPSIVEVFAEAVMPKASEL